MGSKVWALYGNHPHIPFTVSEQDLKSSSYQMWHCPAWTSIGETLIKVIFLFFSVWKQVNPWTTSIFNFHKKIYYLFICFVRTFANMKGKINCENFTKYVYVTWYHFEKRGLRYGLAQMLKDIIVLVLKLELNVLLPLVLMGKVFKQRLIFRLNLDAREAGRT